MAKLVATAALLGAAALVGAGVAVYTTRGRRSAPRTGASKSFLSRQQTLWFTRLPTIELRNAKGMLVKLSPGAGDAGCHLLRRAARPTDPWPDDGMPTNRLSNIGPELKGWVLVTPLEQTACGREVRLRVSPTPTTPCRATHLALAAVGAAITQLIVPDKKGKKADVVLGYDAAADYMVRAVLPCCSAVPCCPSRVVCYGGAFGGALHACTIDMTAAKPGSTTLHKLVA